MQRMICWFLWWLLLYYSSRFSFNAAEDECTGSDPTPGPPCSCTAQCKNCTRKRIPETHCCMEVYSKHFYDGSEQDVIKSVMDIEDILEETSITETTSISTKNIVAAIYKPTDAFSGLEFNTNDKEVKPDEDVSNRKVKVCLPKELDVRENTTVVFCMINFPNKTVMGSELYEGKLFGVNVSGKNISGLQERVNITINITTHINNTQEPRCGFLHVSTNIFMTDGCLTLWDRNGNEITCSCNRLTYFGVLLVSTILSPTDQKNLSYITVIGCSISLFALVITVLIFITNRKLRVDDSKKIHISLSVALILLNLHFLPSEAVAASSIDGLCLYMALGLHYSLLATFSWMALEGLHLYLLLVKVFNIYVRRYLLKLSLVGWGVPAVIVSVVGIVDINNYGHAPVNVSNGTAICYLTNNRIKMGLTLGVFALVFLFNLIMFGEMIKWFVTARSSKQIGRSSHSARKEICTVLSLMSLLGITWGLIFFSFGPLTTPGLYAFCILNSLQGFSIFICFVLSLKGTKVSIEQSTELSTTNSRT